MDQAEKLRSLVNKQKDLRESLEAAKQMRVIAVTSGKGGVGKTNFALNLAIHLAKMNKRVVVIDADFGLANIEVLLGISPRHTFKDVISGEVSLQDSLTAGPAGVRFLSGGSGLTQLADVTDEQLALLVEGFSQLNTLADIVIIDTGAGMSKAVTSLLKASDETIVITTSDPTSVTDAYAIIKVLVEDNPSPPQLKIVVNRVENQAECQEVFKRLHRVCYKFLELSLVNLGCVPNDKYLARAVRSQEPVALMFPNAESTRSIGIIGQRLLNTMPEREVSGLRQFIDRWIGLMRI